MAGYLFMLIEILEDLVEKGSENMDVRNKEEVVLRIRSTVAIKKFRPGGYIVPLPKNPANFKSSTLTMLELRSYFEVVRFA
uniref:Uncharacterized protein n=2 Tax=Oryza TaxID=4527 RepID=A0A0E0RA33_ORYRU